MDVDATSVTDFESSLMDFPELASEFLISLWPSVTFLGVVSVVQCLEGDSSYTAPFVSETAPYCRKINALQPIWLPQI